MSGLGGWKLLSPGLPTLLFRKGSPYAATSPRQSLGSRPASHLCLWHPEAVQRAERPTPRLGVCCGSRVDECLSASPVRSSRLYLWWSLKFTFSKGPEKRWPRKATDEAMSFRCHQRVRRDRQPDPMHNRRQASLVPWGLDFSVIAQPFVTRRLAKRSLRWPITAAGNRI